MAEIRKLEPHEDDVLAAALAAVARPAAAADLFLSDPRCHAFVAADDGRPIGFAYGNEMLRPEGYWVLLLQRLEVIEAARASGAGRDLLDAVAAFARAKGLDAMWLATDAGRDAARRIYPGAGGERHDDGSYWWVFE
jgi:GNAT superfamily N-acetyltransferase